MKSYSIGRDPNCNIVINDPSNQVSRQHATINVDGFKMTIIDNSSNGTHVNNVKISKGVPFPVTRGDVVSFADVAVLDWKRIPSPVHKLAVYVVACFALLAILVGGLFFAKSVLEKQTEEQAQLAEKKMQDKDSMSKSVEKLESDIASLKELSDTVAKNLKNLEKEKSTKAESNALTAVVEKIGEIKAMIGVIDIPALQQSLTRVKDNILDGSGDAKARLEDLQKNYESAKSTLDKSNTMIADVTASLKKLPNKQKKVEPAKGKPAEKKDTTIMSTIIFN